MNDGETLGYKFEGAAYCVNHLPNIDKADPRVSAIRSFDDYGPDGVRCNACGWTIKPARD